MSPTLNSLATAAGLAVEWRDGDGQLHVADPQSLRALLEALALPAGNAEQRQDSSQRLSEEANAWPSLLTADAAERIELPGQWPAGTALEWRGEQGQTFAARLAPDGGLTAPAQPGYYELEIAGRRCTVAVAPPRCFGLADACGEPRPRRWGAAAQVYALRRSGDGGLGDSRAVAELSVVLAAAGADALGLSPLHAMAPASGGYSPYSPSHRGFLNPLHSDPAQVLGQPAVARALTQAGLEQAWQQAEQLELIDWPAHAAMRERLWQALWHDFAQATPAQRQQLHQFEQQGGAALRAHALIAARQAWAVERGESTSWLEWESGWAERGPAPGFFAAAHADALAYEVFKQWLSATCWEQTQQTARGHGMRLGLIVDLAVGFQPGGSEAWRHRDLSLRGLSLGAPPDAFNDQGQSWGISSYAPRGLRHAGFQPFIELLRANMRVGGGVRIDHILGLARLWVVPGGAAASAGAYLHYPLDDLLRLLALESWRHRCVVIGEDLGTLPPQLRGQLAQRGVLGTDVLLFNRDPQGVFLPPSHWRRGAVATSTTHDLSPLAGWRRSIDLHWRSQLQAWDATTLAKAEATRANEVAALERAAAALDPPLTPAPPPLDGAALALVARSASALALLPLEDALGLEQQPNLPGTVEQHPNWRRRLPVFDAAAFVAGLRWFDQQRAQEDRDERP